MSCSDRLQNLRAMVSAEHLIRRIRIGLWMRMWYVQYLVKRSSVAFRLSIRVQMKRKERTLSMYKTRTQRLIMPSCQVPNSEQSGTISNPCPSPFTNLIATDRNLQV